MNIEVDQYTVTSEDPDYRDGLRRYFSKLVDSGAVTVEQTAALVDEETGAYLYEVDVSGGCPGCGSGTNGNICEECGEPNVCVDLVNPRGSRSKTPPKQQPVARFVLPLHKFSSEVTDHHRLGRVPAPLRELADRVFARTRLDLPMTHPSDWGVAPADTTVDGQVIWVWPEMSYGFLYGIEALGERLGRDWRAVAPKQDWKFVHFFGYDNSFYHAVLYPTLYRLAYPQWNPDIDYHVNEFYLLEDGKFSTSRRHAIWGKQILRPETVDAVRFYLSLTRPERRRTNFELEAYTGTVQRVLVDGWQGWLNDLGARVTGQYGGIAPDAGVWTPEHTAFLNRLGIRLAAVADSFGQDGFSLNRAATELDGIVLDTRRFAEAEARTALIAVWKDEARTAIALELAAAQLLARAATPIMPRFAARLAQALGTTEFSSWPSQVELVAAGTRIGLAQQSYFEALPSDWSLAKRATI